MEALWFKTRLQENSTGMLSEGQKRLIENYWSFLSTIRTLFDGITLLRRFPESDGAWVVSVVSGPEFHVLIYGEATANTFSEDVVRNRRLIVDIQVQFDDGFYSNLKLTWGRGGTVLRDTQIPQGDRPLAGQNLAPDHFAGEFADLLVKNFIVLG